MSYISSGFILSAQFINFLSELIIKSPKNTAKTCLKPSKISKSLKNATKTGLKPLKTTIH